MPPQRPMFTHIVLIRHGETDWNAAGRIQGHLAVPLNGRGLAQAEAVAARLAQTRFHALYSSDLLRARQTAEAIARRSGHGVRADRRLREWDLGTLSGLLRTQAEAAHPEAADIYRNRLVDAPLPGGESIRQRYERVIEAVSGIAAGHPGETVVVVSHGGPLGDCYRRAAGIAVAVRAKIDLFNGSINRIRVDGEQWALESWGEVDHLDAIGTMANWEGVLRSWPA